MVIFPKDNTRVSVQLNGLELHTYNRTSVYRELGKTFGYESTYFDLGGGGGKGANLDDEASGGGDDDETSSRGAIQSLSRKCSDTFPLFAMILA